MAVRLKLLLVLIVGILFTIEGMVLVRGSIRRHRDAFCEANHTSSISECFDLYEKQHPYYSYIKTALLDPSSGVYFPLTGRCVKTGSALKSGGHAKGRDYFMCNSAQVFISDLLYGENAERF